MNNDDLVWQIINTSFCSYLVKTKTGKFCRNENNVTGQCNRHSCPLANSRYATIKERDGIIYLYMKEPERVAYPNKQWERVKLSRNEAQAIEQINRHLRYWDRWIRGRVKMRFNRTRAYLKNMRRIALSRQKKVEPVQKRVERRELRREEKALRVARLDRHVEKELLERIRSSTSSREIYNIDQAAFEKAMDTEELPQENNEDEEVEEDEEEEEEEIVYTDASDLELEENEDLEDADMMHQFEGVQSEQDEKEETLVLAAGPSRRKRKVTISVEKDHNCGDSD